ncbi:hypothetical protein Tco_0652993 [Tanacetum coccineum]|uniref:Uncharacterized protein n=1 Tax=Tanacetum coccineum TaxID=301880 RepID=A0ABQ4WZ90_9ASTR
MASLNRRLNPLYAIKECSSCGNLHTKDCGCSKGSLEDKILVPLPDLSQRPLKIENFCLDCGDPVYGLYCRQCALIRKTLEEVFQDFQDTSKSSDDDTNFVNQEPFVTISFVNDVLASLVGKVGQIMQKKEEERRIAEEQAAKDRYWKIPICYDDDDDYTIAITPVLPTKEPVNSLSMGDEHLDTIPATESDEVIKSSVENLLSKNTLRLSSITTMILLRVSYKNIDYVDASPLDDEIVSLEVVDIVIPEVEGIDTDILLTIKDDILREKLLNVNLFIANIEALKDNPTPSSDIVTKSSSTSLNLFLEETNTFDNSLTESFCFDLEKNSSGSTTTHSNYSLPDYEAFYSDDDHIKEKSSGSTTTHADFSQYDSFIFDFSINPFPPADRSDFNHEEFTDELAHIISPSEYDHFCFKIEPELGNLTMDVVEDILPTREPRVHVPNVLPTHPTLNLDLDLILFSEPLFAYIVWIFLPFLTYPVAPPYLLSCGNEDTIFDPGISIYHSFMPGVSHRSGTFMKFNVYPNHLNESPMEILSSTCSPMDQ